MMMKKLMGRDTVPTDLQEESLSARFQFRFEEPFVFAIPLVCALLEPLQLESKLGAQFL